MRRATEKPPKKHRNYANGSRLVLVLDRSYGNDIGYILEMLKYAKDSNKIAIFYGHNIQTDDSLKFVTNVQTLEGICKYVETSNSFYDLKGVGYHLAPFLLCNILWFVLYYLYPYDL